MSVPSQGSVTAFVAVGSNINPEHNILGALDRLKRFVNVRATSRFFRARPIERLDQPMFINGVWKILSIQGARALKFEVLRRIETELGRKRTRDRHASRTIDLDLILYGDEVINEPELHVPDLDIYRRAFVAVPLMELAPKLRVPGSLKPISSLPAAQLGDGLISLPKFSEQLKQRLMQ
ncbi:MAG: 2-amino-4-hydroxy-6-hydroxymethyldihydropteridine diphosphokinase [Deltaproteobacteria bacterium]|nr:2-amino-4-hydroxy-6-hydroxymethyldihydropteridine diphosphokinase [Deltaproteobacteria bacterium]